MKISLVSLPKYPWWGSGTPAYENNLAMKLGVCPEQNLVEQEYLALAKVLQKYVTIQKFPFPQELDANGLNKHDFIFSRDTFISNQQGEMVVSNFAERERQAEAQQMATYLEEKGYKVNHLNQGAYAEGGEFYFCLKDDLLFSGICRNNIHGISETARLLKIDHIQLVESDSFHLDTVFTLLLDKEGHLAGMIVCLNLIKNSQSLKQFAKKRNLELIDISPVDTVATNGQGKISVNCLPIPGVLIGGDKFVTPGVEERIKRLGIKHIISPVSQYKLSGGGVHCLVNELKY